MINKIKRKRTKQEKRRILIASIILALFLALMITILVVFWPYIYGLIKDDPEIKNTVIETIESLGPFAWFILILCSALQVILAVLPNGPFEMIAGLIYGPFLGVIISLVGNMLGCLLVLLLVRILGKGFVSLFVNIDEGNRFSLIKDEKRCLIMIFGLLIIPVLPKDFIVFIVPFTSVKIRNFLLVNLAARTPITIFNVYLGDSLMTGNLTLVIILGSLAAAIGLLCLIFNKKIEEFLTKITSKNNKTQTSTDQNNEVENDNLDY